LNQPSLSTTLRASISSCIILLINFCYCNAKLLAQVNSQPLNSMISEPNKVGGGASKFDNKDDYDDYDDDDDNDDDGGGGDDGNDNDNEEDDKDDENEDNGDEEEDGGDGEYIGDETSSLSRSSTSVIDWLMQRLLSIGVDTRGHRRIFVLHIFEGLVASSPIDFVLQHTKQFLAIAIRINLTVSSPNEQDLILLKEKASIFLDSLETKIGSPSYLSLYGDVLQTLQSTKLEKKRKVASEAITNPRLFALRKVDQTKRKRAQQKNKAAKFMAIRGLNNKRRKKNTNFDL
jgi:hypothetical protein